MRKLLASTSRSFKSEVPTRISNKEKFSGNFVGLNESDQFQPKIDFSLQVIIIGIFVF